MELIIKEAFQTYNRQMESIYEQLTYLKESYSSKEYNLLIEGFWDKVKAIASAIGGKVGTTAGKTVNTIQKSTEYIHDLGKSVYDKGVELGKKAVEIGKELVSKVSEVTKNAVASIKSAPGRLFDACKDIYSSISNEVGEIYKKAKEKGGEFLNAAKTTITEMYNKVASDLSEGINTFKAWASKNIEAFKKMTEEKKSELLEAAKSAEASANETVKKIGAYMKSFYEKGKDAAKNVGYFSIGLVVLPFYASYILAKKTYELGEDTVAVISSGIESIKKNVPEVWAEFSKSFEEGRESEKRPVAERHIQTFESFVYRNY